MSPADLVNNSRLEASTGPCDLDFWPFCRKLDAS